MYPPIQFARPNKADLACCVPISRAVSMSLLGDFSGGVVADLWSQRSDQHEGTLEMQLDLRSVRFDPLSTELSKAAHRVAEQAQGTEQVVRDEGLEHVQLKVAVCSGNADRHIVSHHFSANHGEGLTLSW